MVALVSLTACLLTTGSGIRTSTAAPADRYLIRVKDCDDGCRAYLNGTMVVDIGFADDSNWLDVTQDLTKKKNEVKFQVINKTGAITYRFQVRKNDEIVFDQTCGTVARVGCEDNRAFRVGTAREFTYKIAL
jgi:hypothetical protein